MLAEDEKKVIEKGLLTLWIIWAAIMVSLFIYVFICHQFGNEIRGGMNQDIPLPLFRNIFYAIALITLFAAHFFKRFMLAVKSSSALAKALKPAPNAEQSPLLAKYSTALIVSLALSESIGIYGFVLFLLGDGMQTLYTFIVISALSIYYHRPKREELEALAIAMKTENATNDGL
ncbi:hypothetical protein OAC89_04900 [Deltaproteobacteria bacterium]|nr:hypothetical protein [Deltaproteobacteria bacterium]